MTFTFEEAELLNTFCENKSPSTLTVSSLTLEVQEAIKNTEDPVIIQISESAVTKLNKLSSDQAIFLINNLPVDVETIY